MRDYLAKQVQEKHDKQVKESEIDKLQATIWKEDVQFYLILVDKFQGPLKQKIRVHKRCE